MKHLAVLFGVVGVLGGVAGCDWSLHRMQERPSCTGPCDVQQPDGIVSTDPVAAAPVVDRALIERGRDRFARFCAPCHGIEGDGSSAVARAMTLRRPPSLVDATAAGLDDSRILAVIETGYGLMPAYRALVSPTDRYALLHFIRALQQRDVALDELSPADRMEAERWLH